MNRQLLIFFSATFFVLHAASYSQDSMMFNGKRHKAGFIAGYGGQFAIHVPYDYKVCYLQGQYNYSVVLKRTWSFEILLQPQFNLTNYRYVNDSSERSRGFEYGLNVAVLFRKNFWNDLFGCYIFIGTGPHFVSGVPRRQTEGFIFSDNLFIGLTLKLSENLYLDIRPGFRHISNAGIENPNGGVNTSVISGGVFYTF